MGQKFSLEIGIWKFLAYTIINMAKEKTKGVHNKIKKEAQKFKKQFSSQLLKLVTSGFGLVAALAWNELIKEFIKIYIQPFFGQSSGFVSLLIYALFVTLLAVFVTYQLSKIARKEKEE
ncbi:MAG: hypothetical protein UT24_C0014G0040 [Candidatus Woesebacteria bacterium GW2011_GWB1_39_12]|uniref:Uncharacterized protein n=2 Tax=Candidatus Woeseibacteriota TaxID=1752722 RepID=A0A0G0MD19_9BACT|nr:MAG: hypothetical protein UT23_C0004G0064 [Candidatus Woesebacteria bacterium GW2011_GWA1_39_12]KKR00300.1 MAG: hypothetical protein UT24_C0014G0040 [Candidatus Woesebacteria bacterium GW2011_GWB1_39_12]